MKKQLKRIIYDLTGFILIIASPLLGWLPGPGGIPLLIAGLGLLAVHNEWAQKVLHWAKNNAENFLDIIFPLNNPKIIKLHDIIGASLISIAVVLLLLLPSPFKYIIPVMLTASGLFWLLYNNRRYEVFKRNKHK